VMINSRPSGACLVLAIALLVCVPARAQQTVGLFTNEDPQEGVVLLGPNAATTTYLINNNGLVVNSWATPYRPALMGYLLENGHLLRSARVANTPANFVGAAGRGGRVEEYDWDGNLVWAFEYVGETFLTHHDIEPLPNGNVLMIAWEYLSQTEALAEGKNPFLFNGGQWVDHVIEVRPVPPSGGEIVWEWRARDHLIQDYDSGANNYGIVEDHPELVDFNFGQNSTDWTHFNGIAYNAELDQIVISSRGLNEIWVIDHSTTTEEAAGHTGGVRGKGGDLLYRWGNPRAYRGGESPDQRLFGQHDAQWISPGFPGAGNLLVFNNSATGALGNYSSVDEIAPSIDPDGSYPSPAPGEAFGPADQFWIYLGDPPESLYSSNISGAQRQPNGNTLICEGSSGHLFEVRPGGAVAWDYVSPVVAGNPINQGQPVQQSAVFKARRYPPDYPGLAGRDLTRGEPIEGFTRPFPVPGGSLIAARASADGAIIDLEWDAFGCSSSDYNLIYGDLARVSSYALSGAECGIGVTGGHLWTGVPDSNLFFLVVGTDDLGLYESSWGHDSTGSERSATRASFECGATTKIVTSSCP
jgi:hypothetical protein